MHLVSLNLSVLLLAGCVSLPPGGADRCAARMPRAPYQIDALAGHYRLVQVTTSFPDSERVTELSLARVDSAARAVAAQRRIGHEPRRDLRLLGSWDWSSRYPDVPAEWDAGTLYLDCRDCTDASPDELRILGADSAGFWGTWSNPQTGIGRVADSQGHPLPDPAGYFCATRLDGTPH